MKKMIPLLKMSKKEKKKLAAAQRGNWGDISPITKKVESRKVYDRKRMKNSFSRDTAEGCFSV